MPSSFLIKRKIRSWPLPIADLLRALPLVDNDAAWTAISLVDVQRRAKEDRISHAYFIFNWLLRGPELGSVPARSDMIRTGSTGFGTGNAPREHYQAAAFPGTGSCLIR